MRQFEYLFLIFINLELSFHQNLLRQMKLVVCRNFLKLCFYIGSYANRCISKQEIQLYQDARLSFSVVTLNLELNTKYIFNYSLSPAEPVIEYPLLWWWPRSVPWVGLIKFIDSTNVSSVTKTNGIGFVLPGKTSAADRSNFHCSIFSYRVVCLKTLLSDIHPWHPTSAHIKL